MDEYIFYTAEGHCETPRGDEVYNYQILGFEEGRSEWEAKSKLLKKHAWIEATGYNTREICSAKVLRSK